MCFRFAFLTVLVAGTVTLSACRQDARRSSQVLTGGNAARGATQIAHYGCGACHTIPGIPGAHGIVGPPLSALQSRLYLAGSLSNEPANLVRWITDPHAIKDKTAMPNVGVTDRDAADISAYLYSLE